MSASVTTGTAVLGAVFALAAAFVARRAFLIATTLKAMSWMPILSRRLSRWVKARHCDENELVSADGAPAFWIERRREGLDHLAATLRSQHAQSIAWGTAIRGSFADLRFTDASRVPFPFAQVTRAKFNLCSVVTASNGPYLRTLDGHWTLDVSGSYGFNVAGFDRYKAWMERGLKRVEELGPVLGPLHPIVAENIDLLKRVSQQDDVSFHMSGTEAVMAAVRTARFNTRRRLIVCFSGAYHGWWDGVQPGLGSERMLDDCLTLNDMSPASLAVIRRRAREIAGVLVNPVQSFHPNSPPPNDAVLVTSAVRKAQTSSDGYAGWLQQLREVCTASDVPLIFDEVYSGFRLGPGGAQKYFAVHADMVVYGKTVAGGFPIGVVCGKSALMRRLDPEHPMRMAYVVGTFSAHPAVMAAMNEFLRWALDPSTATLYRGANRTCTEWVKSTNECLADASLPIRVANLATIWTVVFTEPSRYNWLLQYYLRAERITLSWVGTGRCLASLDFSDDDYKTMRERLIAAARKMKNDGWWLTAAQFPERDTRMRMALLKDAAAALVPRPVQTFYAAVMKRKDDDHHASHNNPVNQYLHLVSSSVFLFCYATVWMDLTRAMVLGLAALFVRQFGHAVLEPACHDEEKLLLGYTTRDKTLIVLGYLLIPLAVMMQAHEWGLAVFFASIDRVAVQWFRWTAFVVLLRVAYLTWKHNVHIAMIWFVKLVTDPVTDIVAYFPRRPARA